ncbi:hypothetical protein [Treponema endosymbiont of Eucomonympha sp.]|uniref:hypothetical protein n=1 Tax=Treponema endosymbiont of Eucomonympha sp. TaxID=1580831 RepID=UPI001396BC11|nr:hypothetical protein [Treponema endosymbiont of Eucomonympha sp.]
MPAGEKHTGFAVCGSRQSRRRHAPNQRMRPAPSKDIHPLITIDEAVRVAQDFSTGDSYQFVSAAPDNIRKSPPDGETGR